MDVSKPLARLRRAASAIHFIGRRDTADLRRTFTNRAEMHRFFDEQHDAGYDCFVTPARGSWEVRCYKRMK